MKKLLLSSFILFSFVILAQEKDFHLPKANDEFADKKSITLFFNDEDSIIVVSSLDIYLSINVIYLF
jgi:hypothetical protein